MLTFTIESRDTASPAVEALIKTAPTQLDSLLKTVGRSATNQLKDHYRGVNARYEGKGRGYLGGQTPERRVQFWAKVAQSVSNPKPNGPGKVIVTIGHPAIRHKLEGGTIRPKKAKALTIPVHPEAYGRRARVLKRKKSLKLFVLRGQSGVAMLASKSRGELEIFYLLKKSVTHKPDPQAFPDRTEFEQRLEQVARDFVFLWARRTTQRGLRAQQL
jgi:hypothetical protein